MAPEPPFQEDKPELQAESFTAPLFLQRELLSDQNVLDYFYESKFFDTSSANQRRRKGHRVAEDGEGVEYVLLLSNAAGKGQLMQPPVGYPYNVQNQFGVHLISRVNKRNNVQVPERVYYSISGVIYQAPALQKLVIHKLYKAAITLDKVLSLLTSMCHWNVLSSYNWKAAIDVLSILKDVK
ncbi:MED6 mediator sub complex component [Gregarina niphandrodes]|uniref:Mediator of RNA polymerase II transcription subunit 6 n=1 Tax=Gregarina niphandrodes TaxID=110365 RepID=A0A023B645_GRENI|nr:MED6 mediator sub complex component [Gregarina niphandrodes]EZG65147.1 MED6 mediator sub complex component [Gregarina niphandrodes]|eukprot:XP_011134101.1 MED6 mediator sub complex component [Gregarina niphandrodes]